MPLIEDDQPFGPPVRLPRDPRERPIRGPEDGKRDPVQRDPSTPIDPNPPYDPWAGLPPSPGAGGGGATISPGYGGGGGGAGHFDPWPYIRAMLGAGLINAARSGGADGGQPGASKFSELSTVPTQSIGMTPMMGSDVAVSRVPSRRGLLGEEGQTLLERQSMLNRLSGMNPARQSY